MNARPRLGWLPPTALMLILGLGLSDTRGIVTETIATDNQPEGTILFEITPNIYTIGANGENLRQLVSIGAELAAPKWSPDGQQIAFTGDQEGNWEVYVINADGTGLTNLTQTSADDGLPRWSPDGEKILFLRWQDSFQRSRYYVMNADGTNQAPFFLQDVGVYGWSPTGKWLVYSDGREETEEMFLASANGTEIVQLTDNNYRDFSPTWSPAGERIAFVSSRDGNNEIYIMSNDGSGLTRLTYTPEINEIRPVWSPDGRYIAYQVSGRDFNPLYVMHLDGTNQVRIGEGALLNDTVDYAWSPDGSFLAVSGWHPWEGSYIYVVDIACADSPSGCGWDESGHMPDASIMVNIVKYDPEITAASPAVSLSWNPIYRPSER